MQSIQSKIQSNLVKLFNVKQYHLGPSNNYEKAWRILDEHSRATLNEPLNKELFAEILQKGEVTPSAIGESVAQAYTILKDRLRQIEGPDGYKRTWANALKDLTTKRQQQNGNLSPQEQVILEEAQKQLSQLESDEMSFRYELQQIEIMFLNYDPGTKMKYEHQPVLPNPEHLPKILYLSLAGLVFELFVTRLRPGYLTSCAYLQALYLVLIGYYTKSSAIWLIVSLVIAILLDLLMVAGFITKYMDTQAHGINLRHYLLDTVYSLVLLAMLAVSVMLRVVSLWLLRVFRHPPLGKIEYQIFGRLYTLNTRLSNNFT